MRCRWIRHIDCRGICIQFALDRFEYDLDASKSQSGDNEGDDDEDYEEELADEVPGSFPFTERKKRNRLDLKSDIEIQSQKLPSQGKRNRIEKDLEFEGGARSGIKKSRSISSDSSHVK